jgi:hypothetical protein
MAPYRRWHSSAHSRDTDELDARKGPAMPVETLDTTAPQSAQSSFNCDGDCRRRNLPGKPFARRVRFSKATGNRFDKTLCSTECATAYDAEEDKLNHYQFCLRQDACTQPRAASAEDIAESFGMSERVMDDVLTALDADYSPVLCARAWLDGIEPHREFRCFMQDRQLAGISVYRAWEPTPFPQIVADPTRWESAIRDWFPQFAAVAPLNDLCFDVVVLDNRVVLLEINPAIGSTYPGHFLNKPFDGRFRYLGDGDSDPVE